MDNRHFDWDDANIAHLAKHDVTPEEAEQVILNRPVDLGSQLRNGEDRLAQIGETDAGRILIIVTTTRGVRLHVVTGWPANKDYRRYFTSLKRNGNVGRTQK
jgi:uncharacterized DUF497 family protein